METISDRVKKLRKSLGLIQTDFARRIGISPSALSRIEIGENSLMDRNVLLICTPGRLLEDNTVSRDWLINGGDESLMFEKQPGPDEMARYDKNGKKLSKEECELIWIYQQLSLQNKAVAKKQIDVLLECQGEMYPEPETTAYMAGERQPAYLNGSTEPIPFPERRTIDIPVWGKTAAGVPLGIGEFYPYESTRPCDADLIRGDAADYGWLEVKGNSMTEAGIDDGDWVLIRHTEKPEHGVIMLVRHDNEMTLKRIRITEGEDGREEVRMCWEDGSGMEKRLDDEEYGIQGKFVHVEKQHR